VTATTRTTADLRQRIADALAAAVVLPGATPNTEEQVVLGDLTDAVLPIVAAHEAEALRQLRRSVLAASLAGPKDPRAGETWTAGYRAGLSVAADLATQPADADPDEGDELVCVDECGFCDACGMEPFETPAEGWREAARFLRRTPFDSRDYPAALTGARLIEDYLRARADEMEQQ
jgi:hypothetical protein